MQLDWAHRKKQCYHKIIFKQHLQTNLIKSTVHYDSYIELYVVIYFLFIRV
jgi:hypothetical protein